MGEPTPPRCEALVWEKPHYIRKHRCPNAGRFEETVSDGRTVRLCGVHHNARWYGLIIPAEQESR